MADKSKASAIQVLLEPLGNRAYLSGTYRQRIICTLGHSVHALGIPSKHSEIPRLAFCLVATLLNCAYPHRPES